MTPPINSNNNRCTYCTTQLEPKQNQDRVWYLKCYRLAAHAAENFRPYYYHFPSSATATPASLALSTTPTISTTLAASSNSSPPVPSNFPSAPPQPRCAAPRCTTTRTPSKHCSRAMCKRHCQDRGGCRFHRTNPPPKLLPPLSGPSLDAFNNLRAHADPFPGYDRAARMYQLHEQQRRAAALAIFPTFSPSPTDAQEDADYQLALRLALPGEDDDDQLAPPPAPNAVASTSSTGGTGKKRELSVPSNDEDEVEFVSFRPRIKVEPDTPPRQPKRPRLTVQIPTAPSTLSPPSSGIPTLSASSSTTSFDSLPSPGSSIDFPFYISKS